MLNVDELPFLTRDVPGIGGRIKESPGDFVVEEVPLYEPSGAGTHVYFQIEKTQLTTMQAVQRIARALGRPAREIGYAGLKDAEAVTRQWLSVEHIEVARVESLSVPRVRVVKVTRHGNKLRLGHLRGNRFTLKVRDAVVSRIEDVRSSLAVLGRRGVPNYFGPQRFGLRGDTWKIGRAVLRGEFEEALALMLGRPGPHDYGQVLKARELFERGDYEAAANTWPYPFDNERRVCWAVAKSGGNFARAMRAVDPQLKRFFISAYQSQMFNQVVAERIDGLDSLRPGDLAWRHPQGAVFRVEDVAKEQPRCDAFEISPTGPLFGYRMSEPQGEAGDIEARVMAAETLTPENWRQGADRHKIKGARRPLRFQPQDVSIGVGRDDDGEYLQLLFYLESGCYATALLREICKTGDTEMPEAAPETRNAEQGTQNA